jgi:Lipocalin-like domain
VKRTLISAMTLALATTLAWPVQSQDLASQLVGVWKYTSLVVKEVAGGNVTKPYGEKPVGYHIYTKGGRLIFALVSDNRKAPAAANATAAERINLYDTLASGTGTFKVEGKDTLVLTYDSSWNEAWTGTTQKRQIEIVGNKLTVTSPPVKSAQTGNDVVVVITLERVE